MRTALIIAALLPITISSAGAQVIDDPLHGFCGGAGQCNDNGTNSPTSHNPPTNFGFTISPGPATGDLLLDILVPDNKQAGVTSFAVTGPGATTATLVPGEWTAGNLDTFLGISASPSNPIGAFLPSTVALDPGATGFSVYQDDVGTQTLQDASNPNVSPLYNLASALPAGSYIVGFLNEGGTKGIVATANSGAIFEAVPGPTLGAGLPGLLAAVAGLIGLARHRRRITV